MVCLPLCVFRSTLLTLQPQGPPCEIHFLLQEHLLVWSAHYGRGHLVWPLMYWRHPKNGCSHHRGVTKTVCLRHSLDSMFHSRIYEDHLTFIRLLGASLHRCIEVHKASRWTRPTKIHWLGRTSRSCFCKMEECPYPSSPPRTLQLQSSSLRLQRHLRRNLVRGLSPKWHFKTFTKPKSINFTNLSRFYQEPFAYPTLVIYARKWGVRNYCNYRSHALNPPYRCRIRSIRWPSQFGFLIWPVGRRPSLESNFPLQSVVTDISSYRV